MVRALMKLYYKSYKAGDKITWGYWQGHKVHAIWSNLKVIGLTKDFGFDVVVHVIDFQAFNEQVINTRPDIEDPWVEGECPNCGKLVEDCPGRCDLDFDNKCPTCDSTDPDQPKFVGCLSCEACLDQVREDAEHAAGWYV